MNLPNTPDLKKSSFFDNHNISCSSYNFSFDTKMGQNSMIKISCDFILLILCRLGRLTTSWRSHIYYWRIMLRVWSTYKEIQSSLSSVIFGIHLFWQNLSANTLMQYIRNLLPFPGTLRSAAIIKSHNHSHFPATCVAIRPVTSFCRLYYHESDQGITSILRSQCLHDQLVEILYLTDRYKNRWISYLNNALRKGFSDCKPTFIPCAAPVCPLVTLVKLQVLNRPWSCLLVLIIWKLWKFAFTNWGYDPQPLPRIAQLRTK